MNNNDLILRVYDKNHEVIPLKIELKQDDYEIYDKDVIVDDNLYNVAYRYNSDLIKLQNMMDSFDTKKLTINAIYDKTLDIMQIFNVKIEDKELGYDGTLFVMVSAELNGKDNRYNLTMMDTINYELLDELDKENYNHIVQGCRKPLEKGE